MTTSVTFELARGERLLWSGVPRQGIVFRPSDVFMIPFSFLWGGFAVFWEAGVLRDGPSTFVALWGIPFVLVGLYITVGRFFYDARRRSRTSYGVTSERVIIAGGVLASTLKSLDLRTLSDVTLDEKRDGTGTITFGPTNVMTSMYAGTAWPGVQMPPSFELIPNARRVYDVIRDARRAAAGSVA